jgi:hypothetical protein
MRAKKAHQNTLSRQRTFGIVKWAASNVITPPCGESGAVAAEAADCAVGGFVRDPLPG